MAETFKGPIVNSSRGVEITDQGGSLAGQLQEPRSQEKVDVATQWADHSNLTLNNSVSNEIVFRVLAADQHNFYRYDIVVCCQP